MTTRTETVETVYGDVEVSLVDCDSCGNPVRKREAVEFSIGDRDGWACEHCEEEGPLSFPEHLGVEEPSHLFWLVFTVFAPITAVVCLQFILDPEEETENADMLFGTLIGGLVYGALFYWMLSYSSLLPF